jgi:hypothetical protein
MLRSIWCFLLVGGVTGRCGQKLLVRFAEEDLCEHDTAESGLLALQVVRNTEHPFDVVFMGW